MDSLLSAAVFFAVAFLIAIGSGLGDGWSSANVQRAMASIGGGR